MEIGPKRYPKGRGRRPEFRRWLHFRRSWLKRWRLEEDFDPATAAVSDAEQWLLPLVADFEAFVALVGRMPKAGRGQRVRLEMQSRSLKWRIVDPEMVLYKGRWWRLRRLCESVGISYHAVRVRLNRGWELLEALHRSTKRRGKLD